MQKSKKIYELDKNGNKIPAGKDKTGRQRYKFKKVCINGWNDRSNVEKWRKAWENEANKYLSQENSIDCRSLSAQGITRVATIHEGPRVRAIDRKRFMRSQDATRVHLINSDIQSDNAYAVAVEREAERAEQEAKEAAERAAAAAIKQAELQQRLHYLQEAARRAEAAEEAAEQEAARRTEAVQVAKAEVQHQQDVSLSDATTFNKQQVNDHLAKLRAFDTAYTAEIAAKIGEKRRNNVRREINRTEQQNDVKNENNANNVIADDLVDSRAIETHDDAKTVKNTSKIGEKHRNASVDENIRATSVSGVKNENSTIQTQQQQNSMYSVFDESEKAAAIDFVKTLTEQKQKKAYELIESAANDNKKYTLNQLKKDLRRDDYAAGKHRRYIKRRRNNSRSRGR